MEPEPDLGAVRQLGLDAQPGDADHVAAARVEHGQHVEQARLGGGRPHGLLDEAGHLLEAARREGRVLGGDGMAVDAVQSGDVRLRDVTEADAFALADHAAHAPTVTRVP
ncbi:hypothetical protein GCM10020001_011550 [Nonomuraea salmonea]